MPIDAPTAAPAPPTSSLSTSTSYLAFLFLISGFAALIYQIVWQRTLFAAFGVNIESTTIIVCLFMFGLGVGSFVGGYLAARFPDRAPLLFLLAELGIGLFGLASLPLIHLVTRATLHGSLLTISLATFALLAIPTLFMGATLPILVNHLHRYLQNVGKTVGLLYCINTLGSAIACFVTADLLFVHLGQRKSILIAAACNLLVGFLVWQYSRRLSGSKIEDRGSKMDDRSSILDPRSSSSSSSSIFPYLLSALIGYLSLSQEILWMRSVSYMTGGRPTVFAHVLGFFLIGIALGSFFAERICSRQTSRSPLHWISLLLLLSAIVYYFGQLAVAKLLTLNATLGLWATHFIVAATSFLLGSIFPILCHWAARPGVSVGLTVSRLYLANIIGAVLGPLLTGFVLMEYLATDQIIFAIAFATMLLSALTWFFNYRLDRSSSQMPFYALPAVLILFFVIHRPLYTDFLEKLQFQIRYDRSLRYKNLVENRSGIVSVTHDWSGMSDMLYGGGVYDGTFNVDPWIDSNGVSRMYMLGALHPNPQRVLEIGLASGSWSRVITAYEPVKELVVIEINPAYLKIIAQYPEQASLLSDPKRKIYIDDGRRWLLRNPDEKFDFILQNTTFHWRDHATNLLSREYFELCKRHLNPGGVIYVNTTGSDDVTFTLANVFKHLVRVDNFMAASDAPFTATSEQIRSSLMRFKLNNEIVFADPRRQPTLQRLALHDLSDIASQIRSRTDLRVITDDNMWPEFHLR